MENISVKDVILEKKMSGYDVALDDFKASQELMVEITLSEYRHLVISAATREQAIKSAESDKYTREAEIKALKTQVESLKGENYELKKQVESTIREAEA